jgi:predicted nucleic acid-binding protein
MTSWVVADASIFLASVLQESLTNKSRAIIKSWATTNLMLAAPSLFQYEIIAVLRKNVYQGRISLEESIKGRDILLSQPIQFMLDDDLLRRAHDLSTRFNRPTAYDAQYLAVAERLGCDFWTIDERLYNAVANDLGWVKWLGTFTG